MSTSFLQLFILYAALICTSCTAQRPVRRIPSIAAQLNSNNLNNPSKTVKDKNSEILQQMLQINENGVYNFNFQTTNGISSTQEGRAGHSTQGTTSYISPEGMEITLTYTADETGYHPIGAHIPKIPAHILRGLAYIRAHPFEVRRRYTFVPEINIEPLVAPLKNTKEDIVSMQPVLEKSSSSKIKEATQTRYEFKVKKMQSKPYRGSTKFQQVL